MSGMIPNPAETAPGAHIHGWMGPPELLWLHETAKTMRSIVEVGVNRGRSSYALATGCPGTLWSIDLWDDPGDHGYRAFMENVGHLGNVRAVRGRSPEIAAGIPDVDMVFIDGDHEYESVLADIAAWLPKTGKILCGHDFYEPAEHAGYPGVPRAVRERFGEGFSVAPETSIWVVEL